MQAWIAAVAAAVLSANLAVAQAQDPFADAEALAAAGDIAGALHAYRAVTEADPTSSEAFARLGGMQLLDQRYAQAVRSFQQAITLGDEGTRSFAGMGMAYLHLGQFSAARAAFVEARARAGQDTEDIDAIIGWLDARDAQAARPHP
jgi:Flp pilus assembly protein TadD